MGMVAASPTYVFSAFYQCLFVLTSKAAVSSASQQRLLGAPHSKVPCQGCLVGLPFRTACQWWFLLAYLRVKGTKGLIK